MMKYLFKIFTPTINISNMRMEEYISKYPSKIISLLTFFLKTSGYYNRFIRNNKNITISLHLIIDVCSASYIVLIVFFKYNNDGSISEIWNKEILCIKENCFYSKIKDKYRLKTDFLLNLTDILRRTQKRLIEID